MDAATLEKIHQECFPNYWKESEFKSLIERGAQGFIVDDKGFILCRIAADEAEILTFAVSPDVRRKGIGEALLQKVMGALYQRKICTLFLEVAADNMAAVTLYTKIGFTQKSVRKAYYQSKIDALVLSKPLF